MTTQLCSYIVSPSASNPSSLVQKIQFHFALKLQAAYRESDRQAVIISCIEPHNQDGIQEQWVTVDTETEAISKMREVLSDGHPVIYNPLECDRASRMLFLQAVSDLDAKWVGWGINVELDQEENTAEISREVQNLINDLPPLPPLSVEGFVTKGDREKVKVILSQVKKNPEIKEIQFKPKVLEKSPHRVIAGRKNNPRHIIPHQYSQILDFDRLMHLISLLIRYPGIGELSKTDPDTLREALKHPESLPVFEDELAEICAIMTQQYHWIYSDRATIAQDLAWLQENGFIDITEKIGELDLKADLSLSKVDDLNVSAIHRYSDEVPFQRLLKLIRLIVHEPFYTTKDAKTIIEGIKQKLNLYEKKAEQQHSLRKDIELVLNPYRILDSQCSYRRKGYYLGTGILSRRQMQNVYRLLKSRTIRFNDHDDQETLKSYEEIQHRIKQANLIPSDYYEFIVVKVSSSIAEESLSEHSLARENKMKQLQEAFLNGECLKLCRQKKAGQYNLENQEHEFWAYPLQIIFHKIAWYLGYQIAGQGNNKDLFCYGRLDRFEKTGKNPDYKRDFEAQKKARKKLDQLYKASPGIHLGNRVDWQKQYIAGGKARKEVTETIELWIDQRAYPFVREGRLRFGQDHGEPKPQKNQDFPYKLELSFPKWSLQDIDLKRWILGFQGGIRVENPPELKKQIRDEAAKILEAHND
jgi:hypothetical protein